jgi:hypothetical protein
MGEKAQIRVTVDQRETLHDLKRPGETYADALDRVLDAAGVDHDEDGDVAAALN